MKKTVFLLMAMLAMVFTGCDKDDEAKFDYDVNLLYGRWRVTHVMQGDGQYIDVTTSVAERVFKPTYATFNANGTYTGSGEFGDGSGTYTAIGKTITTFVDGEEYLKYDVISLTGTNAELSIRESGQSSTLKIKVEKQ